MNDGAGRLRDTLAVLDVGHGSSAVLFSGDDVAVFDTGPGSGLLRFLKEQNVNRIKTVFVSHADLDHIGGLVGLLAANTVTVERVVLNTDSSQRSEAWDDLTHELDARHRAGKTTVKTTIREGDSEAFGTVTATAAGPSTYLAARGPGSTDRSGRRITSNSISAVFRLTVDASPIALLTGDLDVVGFENLLGVGGALDAPVLVFPHHGGGVGGSNVAGFVTKLVKSARPGVVLFSIGRRRTGTPDPQVVHYLRQAEPAARIVCTQLSQHCAKARPTFTPTHLSPVFARGRSDGACCGGTILISLRDAPGITPDSANHLEFIRKAAETPLCMGPIPAVERPLRPSAGRRTGPSCGA